MYIFRIAFLIFVLLAQTDTNPLDETASRHSEANPDQADEIPEPTTKIILPNVSLSNLSCLRPSLPVSFFFILGVGFVLIMSGFMSESWSVF